MARPRYTAFSTTLKFVRQRIARMKPDLPTALLVGFSIGATYILYKGLIRPDDRAPPQPSMSIKDPESVAAFIKQNYWTNRKVDSEFVAWLIAQHYFSAKDVDDKIIADLATHYGIDPSAVYQIIIQLYKEPKPEADGEWKDLAVPDSDDERRARRVGSVGTRRATEWAANARFHRKLAAAKRRINNRLNKDGLRVDSGVASPTTAQVVNGCEGL